MGGSSIDQLNLRLIKKYHGGRIPVDEDIDALDALRNVKFVEGGGLLSHGSALETVYSTDTGLKVYGTYWGTLDSEREDPVRTALENLYWRAQNIIRERLTHSLG